jgi:hypothetical protein
MEPLSSGESDAARGPVDRLGVPGVGDARDAFEPSCTSTQCIIND